MKNRIGIICKQFLIYFSVVASSLIIIIFLISHQTKKIYLDIIESNLKKQAEIFSELIKFENKKNIDSLSKEIGQKLKIRYTIINSDGEVLGDSEKNIKEMDNHIQRPEVQSALKFGSGKSIRYSKTLKKEMMYLAISKNFDKDVYIIRTSIPIDYIKKATNKLNITITIFIFSFILIALLITIISSSSLSSSIKQIIEVAKKIKNGEFKYRVYLKNKDNEFNTLANVINQMAEELEKLFHNIKEDKERLQTIISSMNEGLLVFNEQGEIILFNKSFLNLFNLTQQQSIIGKRYWEIIQDINFSKFVETLIKEKNFYTFELNYGPKIYKVNGKIIENEIIKNIIVIFYDITEAKNLEKLKMDFVANVAHELKTPLTTIKGFIETIINNEKDSENLHFLNIIERNINRLINIVSDLLLLSNIERPEFKIQIEKIDLKIFLDDILKIFEQKIKEKGLELEIQIANEIKYINADPFLFEQLFINLLDNAINYTEKGKISIKFKILNDKLNFEIADTGIGIPEESIPKIFERFYVVDKSRSRQKGGTGLGLSIVKHIVQLHNGEIYVESKIAEGSKFIINLPLKLQ